MMWLGVSSASWMIHSPRSVSTTSQPAGLERLVEPVSSVAIDFDFTIVRAGRRDRRDVGVGVGRRRSAQHTWPPSAAKRSASCSSTAGRSAQDLGLDRRAAARRPSGSSSSARPSTACRRRSGRRPARVRAAQHGVGHGRGGPRRSGAVPSRSSPAHGPSPLPWCITGACDVRFGDRGGASASTSARWRVRDRLAGGLGPAAQVQRHEESEPTTRSAPVAPASDAQLLVGHRLGHLGQLHAEQPAEAAAALVVGPRHAVAALDRVEQLRPAGRAPRSSRSMWHEWW